MGRITQNSNNDKMTCGLCFHEKEAIFGTLHLNRGNCCVDCYDNIVVPTKIIMERNAMWSEISGEYAPNNFGNYMDFMRNGVIA
jgi:hypothetical protein